MKKMITAKKVRILLAQDYEGVRQSLCECLQNESDLTVVGQTGDGDEAVMLSQKLKPDVVLMDLHMRKLNGIEAIKLIKSDNPSTVVFILTPYDYDQYIFALIDAAACGYLPETATSRQIVEAIHAALEGEQVLRQAIVRKVVEHFGLLTKEKHKPPELLTEREMGVLTKAARGMSNKHIAEELRLSTRIVKDFLESIFNKLGVGSRTEAVVCAVKNGLLGLEDISEN